MDWVQLGGLIATIVFFAGVYVALIRSLKGEIRELKEENRLIREHNEFQDKQISETHTTSQVILTTLAFISKSIERIERKQDKMNASEEGGT